MIWDFIKDIFSSPDSAFKKLTPQYFREQRTKLFSAEEYAKWLKKQAVYYGTMAHFRKKEGLSLPQLWIDSFNLLENEIEKVKTQGVSNIFQDDVVKKMSDNFK